MKKYVLYVDNQLTIENIIDVADTENEIREKYKMAKVFRRMLGLEPPQIALVEMTEDELATILNK